jgi:hypothetical protein
MYHTRAKSPDSIATVLEDLVEVLLPLSVIFNVVWKVPKVRVCSRSMSRLLRQLKSSVPLPLEVSPPGEVARGDIVNSVPSKEEISSASLSRPLSMMET